jgi:rod shape-determining protein MreD
MRWVPFAIAAVLAAVLDTSNLMDLFTLRGLGSLTPSLTAIVAVFVALFAPKTIALWAAWCLGLLADLCPPNETVVIGPYTLGYVFGAYAVVQVRTLVFRRRVLTVAVLTVVCLVAVGVVSVGLGTLRSWYPGAPAPWADFRPLPELGRSLGIAVYSGLFALPVGWLLMRTQPLWGFQHAGDRRRF